MLAIELHN